jgi:O-acetyl-ADP-ribose deacetylase (regulator of RNase III)
MAYQCNNTTFVSEYGDITDLDVDAMVVASCPTLSMDAGIALKIKDKGGQSIEAEAVECAPCETGSVVETSCGNLSAKAVYHCVILNDEKKADADTLRQCVRKTLQMAHERGYKRLAFPALGSAFPGLSPKLSTEIIVEESVQAVESGMDFESLTFIVCDSTPYRYYKKALKSQFKA